MVHIKTIEGLNAKLEWAERHIHDLQYRWTRFRKDGYRVAFKDDSKMRQRVYYLADVRPMDPDFSLIVGDAVHGLRCALDHLAFRVMSISPDVTPRQLGRVYFPIAEDAQKYKTEARTRIEGMRQDAIDAIDGIEPYGGGAGEALWHLHSLDIIDKHKLLLTIGSTNTFHSMTPRQIAALKRNFLGMDLDAYTPAQDAILFQTGTTNTQFPLKTGDILAVIPKSEVNKHMHFTFEIAFGEPEVVRGKPIIQTLHNMAHRISCIIREFTYRNMIG